MREKYYKLDKIYEGYQGIILLDITHVCRPIYTAGLYLLFIQRFNLIYDSWSQAVFDPRSAQSV